MMLADLVTLLPMVVLAATAIAVMLAIAIYRNHFLTLALVLVGLLSAFITLFVSTSTHSPQVTPLLIMDEYALFYQGLLLAAVFSIAILSYGYLRKHQEHHEEFYLLLVLATLGAAALVASNHLISFFLGLEILSVALYGLTAYLRHREHSVEAGLKYLILAASSAAFLLFGMALVYAELGELTFEAIASAFAAPAAAPTVLSFVGLAMIVVGVGFKLGVVPFHMWSPDVYEGSPAPVAAFIASVSKGSMFALALRLFVQLKLDAGQPLFVTFGVIAIASMFVGNLLALLQNNLKRILAYSSIAHLGYLLIPLLAGGSGGTAAATFYLVTYFGSVLAAFSCLIALSNRQRDADRLEDYQGLFWRHPWLAMILASALLSLAGLPFMAGFMGKFFLLAAGTGSAFWWLAFSLVVSSVIGLYYYLRITAVLFRPLGADEIEFPMPSLSVLESLVLAAQGILILWLGIYPGPILGVIEKVVAQFA